MSKYLKIQNIINNNNNIIKRWKANIQTDLKKSWKHCKSHECNVNVKYKTKWN